MWSHKFEFAPISGPDWKPTEFIRWIREFGLLKPEIVTSAAPDGFLKLGPQPMSTAPYYGMTCYCESYGGVLKAFLNPEPGIVIVEIIDDELVPFAEEAIKRL